MSAAPTGLPAVIAELEQALRETAAACRKRIELEQDAEAAALAAMRACRELRRVVWERPVAEATPRPTLVPDAPKHGGPRKGTGRKPAPPFDGPAARARREALGLSREAMAKALQCAYTTIAGGENGGRNVAPGLQRRWLELLDGVENGTYRVGQRMRGRSVILGL